MWKPGRRPLDGRGGGGLFVCLLASPFVLRYSLSLNFLAAELGRKLRVALCFQLYVRMRLWRRATEVSVLVAVARFPSSMVIYPITAVVQFSEERSGWELEE